MDKHTFSIVMDSKRHVKNVLISDKLNQKVFIEGDLGKFVNVEIVEEVLLEIQGTNGMRARAREVEVVDMPWVVIDVENEPAHRIRRSLGIRFSRVCLAFFATQGSLGFLGCIMVYIM